MFRETYYLMRRGLSMRPVAGRRTESGNPVNGLAAVRTVEHQLPKLPFNVRLHVQKLQPQQFGLERYRMRSVKASRQSLIHERVRGCRLVANDAYRTLKDVTLVSGHAGMLGRPSDAPHHGPSGCRHLASGNDSTRRWPSD